MWATALNPRGLECLSHPSVERLKVPPRSCLYLWKSLAGNVVILPCSQWAALGAGHAAALAEFSFPSSEPGESYVHSLNRNRCRKALPSVWQERASCL